MDAASFVDRKEFLIGEQSLGQTRQALGHQPADQVNYTFAQIGIPLMAAYAQCGPKPMVVHSS